jgi:H+/Cl- antiporter ClcA
MNAEINYFRKVYLDRKWKKVFETVALTTFTALLIFYAPLITSSDCTVEETFQVDSEFIQYTCDKGEYNPLATLLLNPEGNSIKALLNKQAIFAYNPLLVHFLIWFLLTILTYGTAVPAGLFLPGILIGCGLGRMLTLFISMNMEHSTVQPATYAIIGAASVLAGYSRMSFSLAVIMLETTENVNLFLPIIFALFISFAVGRLFSRSIYVNALSAKSVPFLIETVPQIHTHLRAKDVMSQDIHFLQINPTVQEISAALK